MRARVLAFAFLLACGDDGGDEKAAGGACAAGVLEDDAVDSPLSGPGVKNGVIEAPAGATISTTYLVLRPEQGARFEALMGPIMQQLPTQPGLLAYQFKTSARCGTARTFAVWASEEEMFAFVTSPAHLTAMREQAVVATPDSTTVAFAAEGPADLRWERAARELEASAATR